MNAIREYPPADARQDQYPPRQHTASLAEGSLPNNSRLDSGYEHHSTAPKADMGDGKPRVSLPKPLSKHRDSLVLVLGTYDIYLTPGMKWTPGQVPHGYVPRAGGQEHGAALAGTGGDMEHADGVVVQIENRRHELQYPRLSNDLKYLVVKLVGTKMLQVQQLE